MRGNETHIQNKCEWNSAGMKKKTQKKGQTLIAPTPGSLNPAQISVPYHLGQVLMLSLHPGHRIFIFGEVLSDWIAYQPRRPFTLVEQMRVDFTDLLTTLGENLAGRFTLTFDHNRHLSSPKWAPGFHPAPPFLLNQEHIEQEVGPERRDGYDRAVHRRAS
jgi:hypothetical protein